MTISPRVAVPVEEPHIEAAPIMPSRDIVRELDHLVAAAERIDFLARHLDEPSAERSVDAILREEQRMRSAMAAYNGRTGLSLCALSLLNVPIKRTGDLPYLVLAGVAIGLGVSESLERIERSAELKLVAAALGVQDLASVATVRASKYRGKNNTPLTLTDLARRTRDDAACALSTFLSNHEAPRREDYGP